MTVPSRQAAGIKVKNFLKNGETVPDVVNPGQYYLAGSIGYCLANGSCPSGYKTNDFVITFSTSTGVFNITLTSQPFTSARNEAEQFLESRLNISEVAMCNLLYYVWVAPSLDPAYTYDGINVGWSFCPGAVALP